MTINTTLKPGTALVSYETNYNIHSQLHGLTLYGNNGGEFLDYLDLKEVAQLQDFLNEHFPKDTEQKE